MRVLVIDPDSARAALVAEGLAGVDPLEVRHRPVYDEAEAAADEIVADLNESGGSLQFSYNLDINSSLFSKNTVNITVREAQ